MPVLKSDHINKGALMIIGYQEFESDVSQSLIK